VLRCNDCVDYHLERCVEEGYDRDELDEAMSVALMVGGSIVIPHARHAAESIDYLLAKK
ncbi:MAG: carboxymuconolactone decarboxylase family protein, partial [Xanthomonadales bacterium]|nr:carboxymuconolactone decarboxylase family protein [Xanthomonadales bacterium]